MSGWNEWVGREERREERLDAALARRWCATFDLPGPPDPLPQGIHFCLCAPEAATGDLGEDGHPRRSSGSGGLLPPIPQPRRMWAGSAIAFHRPVAIGDLIVRTSRVAAISEKKGSSGPLVFVEVEHETHADGSLAVSERQTLVFRGAAPPDAGLSPPELSGNRFNPGNGDAYRVVTPDPMLLFRYSALTFNSHRIHYDLPYARDIERYRGLVVHGPLTASLLLLLAGERFGHNRLADFSFRGTSPAVAGEELHLVLRGSGDAYEMGAFASDGRQVTKAEARLA